MPHPPGAAGTPAGQPWGSRGDYYTVPAGGAPTRCPRAWDEEGACHSRWRTPYPAAAGAAASSESGCCCTPRCPLDRTGRLFEGSCPAIGRRHLGGVGRPPVLQSTRLEVARWEGGPLGAAGGK